jgi:putative two-component system response regulator
VTEPQDFSGNTASEPRVSGMPWGGLEKMSATILLGDSDPITRQGWEAILRDQGYSVTAVASEEALFAFCPRICPDLILINASLPDIRGAEICRRLKTDPQNALTPIILITNPSDDSDFSRDLDVCADDLWKSVPSRWEVLNRLYSLLHIKSLIDNQAVAGLATLARSIEARDPRMRGHCERVSILATELGESLGICARDLTALKIAASIHDIGKIMLPDSILLKPGWLTLEERKIMEQHPIEGERLCAPFRSLRDVLPIIRHHHERMDGSGYPDRLWRTLIPFGARVLQIVDTYDALTTDRAYRKGVTPQEALTILFREADRGWHDRCLVNRFASQVVARPVAYGFASTKLYAS